MYAKQALIEKMNFNWTDWYGVLFVIFDNSLLNE